MKQVILASCCLIFLAGCWDKKEIEEQAYIMAIGLDKAEEGKVEVTFLSSNPEVGATTTGGNTNEPPSEIVSFVANDFVSARDTANAFIAKQLSFHHTRTLVVSEELARSEEFIKYLYSTLRDRQLRREMNIVVSLEKAKDFLRDNKPLMETRPHKYFQFMLDRSVETGLSPNSDVHRFLQITEGDADLFLAMYATASKNQDDNKVENEDEYYAGQIDKEGGNPTQIIGAAVFKEGKMIGKLTGEQTRISLLLDNSSVAESMLVTYPDPLHEDYRISLRLIKKEDTEIKMDVDSNPQKIRVFLPLSFELLAIPSLEDYIIEKKKQKLLENFFEETLERKLEEFITLTQTEFKANPFYWSLVARREFLTNAGYTNFDFMKSYPNMQIEVDVQIRLAEFGQQIKIPDLPEVRD